MDNGRVILGVFAHPDDETSGCGGTFARYAREGAAVFNITATRGELGSLGSGDLTIAREDLPKVRESELRVVLKSYGANPPIILGYRDQGLKDADLEVLVDKVYEVMARVDPDVVITFGPLGISRHDDHMTLHTATVAAFERYYDQVKKSPRLFYVCIPPQLAEEWELEIDGPDVDPTHVIDIAETKSLKIGALRTYVSQEDAQELADIVEEWPAANEWFHQARPSPCRDNGMANGFW